MEALAQVQQAQQGLSTLPHTLPAAPASLTLANPSHPQHTLFQQAYDGLKTLDPARLGFTNEQQYRNAAGTAAFEASVSGLKQIDHMAVNRDGTGLTAVQGSLTDPGHQRVYIDKDLAIGQPLERSTALMQQDMQQQRDMQQQQTPHQTTSGPSR